MSRTFTWWRRFYAPIKLPKQYYFKGLSPLLQKIEAGEFEFNHLFLESKLEDRIYEIELEEYTKKIQIEGRVLGDISLNHVIPTAIRYQNTLIENVKGLKEIFGTEFEKIAKEQIRLIKEISIHIEGINSKVEEMTNARKKANSLTDAQEMAEAYCNKVKPYFEIIREHCDKLELLVDDEIWTLTKYRELLFTK